jgi:hypothetical protein
VDSIALLLCFLAERFAPPPSSNDGEVTSTSPTHPPPPFLPSSGEGATTTVITHLRTTTYPRKRNKQQQQKNVHTETKRLHRVLRGRPKQAGVCQSSPHVLLEPSVSLGFYPLHFFCLFTVVAVSIVGCLPCVVNALSVSTSFHLSPLCARRASSTLFQPPRTLIRRQTTERKAKRAQKQQVKRDETENLQTCCGS